jgi:hypothetical protein
VKKLLILPRSSRTAMAISILALLVAIPVAGIAQTPQTPEPLDVMDKLHYHVKSTVGPAAILGDAAYAGILQAAAAPTEWRGGAAAYGKRIGSMVAWSGIHSALAFGLDSTLHQDPRYFRSSGTGFWRRSGHALRGTILTRTDSGGETFSTWRIGSAYGSAVLSNLWYPDRLNTARLGFIQGSVTIGLDLASNLGREFWPDIKRKVFKK